MNEDPRRVILIEIPRVNLSQSELPPRFSEVECPYEGLRWIVKVIPNTRQTELTFFNLQDDLRIPSSDFDSAISLSFTPLGKIVCKMGRRGKYDAKAEHHDMKTILAQILSHN